MEAQEQYVDPQLLAAYYQKHGANDPSFMKFTLSTKQALDNLKWDLLGFSLSEDGTQYEKDPEKMEQVNVQGANALMTYIRPRINKIFSLSNLDETEIDNRCKEFAFDMVFFIGRHKKDFGIMSYSAARQIVGLFDDMFYATCVKAINGWEGDSIRKTHTTHETRQTMIEGSEKQKPMGKIGQGLIWR